jgi:hypothetical protein
MSSRSMKKPRGPPSSAPTDQSSSSIKKQKTGRSDASANAFVYAPNEPTEKPTKCTRILVMAMHYSPGCGESDTVRIDALMDEGWSVCSVDKWNHRDTPGDTIGHITMDFKGLRAIQRLIDDYPAPRLLVLDYFWLQQNYYAEAYGENWHRKAKLLLDGWSGLHAVLLPIDDPRGRASSMRQQLKKLDSSLAFLELGKDDDSNPLVRCTKAAGRALQRIDCGRTHDAQTWRIAGFALIFRASDSAETILHGIRQGICQQQEDKKFTKDVE